jgi:phenylpyruvate tautomerase PptA (4-oxalocrotonate tautomerase family)
MPLIQITLTGPQAAPATIQRLQQETTRLMQTLLHKEAALTVVSVSQLPPVPSPGGQAVATRQPAGADYRRHE